MEKQYSQEALDIIRTGQEKTENGIPIIYKRVPETDDPGAVDPHTLKTAKKMARMMKFVPKKKQQEMFGDLEQIRKIFNGIKSIPVTREDMRIEHVDVPGEGGAIPTRIYFPQGEAKDLPVLYFIHGGGGFAGSPDVVEQACKMITDMHPCITVSPDYRLAPENPFPAGQEDCWTVLNWISQNIAACGGDPDRIAVSGDSFGGTATLYCALRDRDAKTNMVKLMILYYPGADLSDEPDEFYRKPTPADFEIDEKYKKYVNPFMMGDMVGGLGAIMGDADMKEPYLSPYLADLQGMPPTLIMVGGHDYLMPSSKALAAKLTSLGTPVKTIVYRGVGHAFLDEVGVMPQAEDSLKEASAAMTEYL